MTFHFLKHKLEYVIIAIIAVSFTVPHVAFAAPTGFVGFVSLIEAIISSLFPLVTAAGFLAVGYNLIRYLSSKDSTDQNVYKAGIVNAMIGLFAMLVVYGVVSILAKSLGLTLGSAATIADPSGSGTGGINTFRYFAFKFSTFVSSRIVPILIASSTLFFLGNIVISMTKSNVEEERTKLNAYLKWGIIALFIILTLFSIVGVITGSLFGVGAIVPQFPTS